MTHVDFFSGLGSWAIAAANNGLKTIALCEREEWLAKGLEKIWEVPCFRDINDLLTLCQESVRIVGNERYLEVNRFVSRAIQLRFGNGERKTERDTENREGLIAPGQKQKCSPITAEDVSAAEKLLRNFLHSITSSTTETSHSETPSSGKSQTKS